MKNQKRDQILITGANGFLGKYLSNFLSKQNYNIKKVSRTKCNDEIKDLDLKKEIDWSQILKNVKCIIHTAAKVHEYIDNKSNDDYLKINSNATIRLAEQALLCGVRRFIYISTVKVCGEISNKYNPLNENSEAFVEDLYSKSKKNAEEKLISIAKKNIMEVVIIRPPIIYGPNVKANFLNLIIWLDRGIPLPLDRINNLRSMIYIKNLCNFIEKCITHKNAANEIFLVSDDQDISTSDLLKIISHKLGKKNKIFFLPENILYPVFYILGKKNIYKKLFCSLNIDISKAKKLIGWKPVIDINDGIEKTVNYYKNNGI